MLIAKQGGSGNNFIVFGDWTHNLPLSAVDTLPQGLWACIVLIAGVYAVVHMRLLYCLHLAVAPHCYSSSYLHFVPHNSKQAALTLNHNQRRLKVLCTIMRKPTEPSRASKVPQCRKKPGADWSAALTAWGGKEIQNNYYNNYKSGQITVTSWPTPKKCDHSSSNCKDVIVKRSVVLHKSEKSRSLLAKNTRKLVPPNLNWSNSKDAAQRWMRPLC